MQFEWDENKNKINLEKHGISFQEAIQVWLDPLGFDLYDDLHSSLTEERWFRFGKLNNGKIIRVVYKEVKEDSLRIITAYSNNDIERFYKENDGR